MKPVMHPMLSITAIPLLVAMLSGCATTGGALATGTPDLLRVGREAQGEPCTATRVWKDPQAPDLFAQSYRLSCRGVSANRATGSVRLVTASELSAIDAVRSCGGATPLTLPGVGRVEARRCFDRSLDSDVLAIRGPADGRMIDGAAIPAAAAPLVETMRRVAGRSASGDLDGPPLASPIDFAALAPPPGPGADTAMTAAAEADFDPQLALAQGIRLNHKGLHLEASRVLNDAESRVDAGTPAAIRAELSLEAGLADSNINFSQSAQAHFARASELMASAPSARTEFLVRKRDAYVALDLLNRRDYAGALVALDRLGTGPVDTSQPLLDPRNLQLLNQARADKATSSGAVALPNFDLLEQLVVDAQVNWARSVALFALGRIADAQVAIDRARRQYEPLATANIDQTPVLWLGARIDRQEGRLAARKKDWPRAIARFDRALDGLRRGSIGTAGTGNEPVVAETQLERASVLAQSGAPVAQVKADYAAAVDAVIAADARGSILSFGIERYLELLLADVAANDAGAIDRYFRTLQAIGEPAVARQLGQLQAEVSADPAIGVLVRDRGDLEREITRLRYAIADAEAGTATGAGTQLSTGTLNAQRADAERKLVEVSTKLSQNSRFSSVDDRPVTIDGLRAVLRPGEIFLKLSEVNGRIYALIVAKDQLWAHRVAAPAAKLAQYGAELRRSIDGTLGEGTLIPFKVDTSYVTFRLLMGKAYEAVAAAPALVVDPGGPLDNLPASLLVTDLASVQRYLKAAPADRFDYTQTGFLGRTAAISTAVSPRSFLVARALPPSRAAQRFLGFAQHQPMAGGGGELIEVGNACSVPMARIAELSRELKPISLREVAIAADALGGPVAPPMTGADFTDLGVEARTDLAQYQVLHFATHGLQEGSWGCLRSPPALVTSYGGKGSDGLLSFDEIARLRLDANLVVLSACDTSAGVRDETLARQSGQEEAGSKLEGLVRAFLTANARAVMATYWQVSAGEDSELFVGTFYRTARDQPIGDALRAAQTALIARKEYSHPFYWAPYFLVGDASKALLATAPQQVAAIPTGAGGN